MASWATFGPHPGGQNGLPEGVVQEVARVGVCGVHRGHVAVPSMDGTAGVLAYGHGWHRLAGPSA